MWADDHECQGLRGIPKTEDNRLIGLAAVITTRIKCAGVIPVIDQLLDGIGADPRFFRGQLPLIGVCECQVHVRQQQCANDPVRRDQLAFDEIGPAGIDKVLIAVLDQVHRCIDECVAPVAQRLGIAEQDFHIIDLHRDLRRFQAEGLEVNRVCRVMAG